MTYRVLSEVLYHPPIEQLRRSETPPPIPRTSPGVPSISLLLNRDFFRLEFLEMSRMKGGTKVRTRTRLRQGRTRQVQGCGQSCPQKFRQMENAPTRTPTSRFPRARTLEFLE